MTTEIKPCNCKNEYQDETYGEGMRVHNSKGGRDGAGFRCTVCGSERQ